MPLLPGEDVQVADLEHLIPSTRKKKRGISLTILNSSTTRVMPLNIFLPLLIGGALMAACYGATFMLTAHLEQQGFDPTLAGVAVSSGIIITLILACFAGRMAEHLGLSKSIALSAVLMSLAMLSFAVAGVAPAAIYAGGIFLGAAWAIFYMLAPLIIIDLVDSSVRIRYLTFLSGTQMLGLGLAEPAGSMLANLGATYTEIYGGLCVFSLFCAGLFLRMSHHELAHQSPHSLTISAAIRVMRSKAVLPSIVITLLACIFSGLATFQLLYAEPRGLNGSTFFVTFTVVTVILRFSVASQIAKLPIYSLAIVLILIIMSALGLLALNRGSLPLYMLSSALFAIGYGLSYSTLNAIAINIAEATELPISVSSQIFTLFYFAGIFGFPFIGSQLISLLSIDAMVLVLLGVCISAMLLGVILRVRA